MSIDPVSIGIEVALFAASTALTMSRKIEGPRLDSLKFTGGDYGAPLAMVWAKRRLAVPIFFAEDLKEVKQRRKTKGGKYNDYTYYGTWAVALAGHEIAGITRIWFDKHLVYDLTGTGPVTPFDFGGTGTISDFITVYLGTETQTQDSRMQATVEAKHGEGSCPAYRGTAYIMFKDLPLEKLGNRIPQVEVEVLSEATPFIPTEHHSTIPDADFLYRFRFSGDYARFAWLFDDTFAHWETATRSPMVTGPITPYTLSGPDRSIGLSKDGTIYFALEGSGQDKLFTVTPEGIVSPIFDFASGQYGAFIVTDGNGTEHWGTTPFSFLTTWYFDGAEFATPSFQPSFYFTDDRGNIWVIGNAGGGDVKLSRLVTVDDGGYLETMTLSLGGSVAYAAAHDGQFTVFSNDLLWMVDPLTGAATAGPALASGTNTAAVPTAFANLVPGSASIWLGNREYSLTDGTLLRSELTIPAGSGDWPAVYDPKNNALIVYDGGGDGGLTWYFLDRVTSAGVPLSQIASDVADQVGILDYDFSALDQIIPGWSATRGQASNILEPLFDAYDSDLRPHEFEVQGIKRTGVSTGSILTSEYVGTPRYTAKIRQAAELPAALTISFADLAADQQVNTVRMARPLDATDARGEQAIDLGTLALGVDAARGLGDRYFRRVWNERKELSLSLTAQYLKFEPGDVQTLDLDGEELTARLVKLTIGADDKLATEWKYDHPSLAALSGAAGAAFDGRDASVVVVPLLSKGFVLDVPLLTDADNSVNPLLYIAASSYSVGTWPGAVMYEAIGGEYTDEVGSIPSSAPATWGTATDVLADANPNLWDRTGSVNVVLQVGSLTGCTEAAIDTDPSLNLCLIGSELVNFTSAVLQMDGSYTLSGFKRGRRGTEWATATHAARDVFLLLNTADAKDLGLSDVGTSMSFKAITAGRSEGGTFPIPLSFSGASLKPYAPCHLDAVKDSGSGDWTLTWIRRSRIGGAWTSGTTVPLGEASEEYAVEIMNGLSVVRTITGLTSPTATWTAAQQSTDFGSGQSAVTFRVYQISASVGRGFRASATV